VAVTLRRDATARVAVAALVGCQLMSNARAAGPLDGVASLQRGIDADLGRGVTKSAGEAYRQYADAARQGRADAELNLAVMNDSGVGRMRDAALAALWYARAASHGEGRAAYDLGQLYAAGDGVRRDPWLAAAWFRQAAGNGITAARRPRPVPHDADAEPLMPVRLRDPGLPEQSSAEAELVWEPQTSGPGLRYWVEVTRTTNAVFETIAYASTEVSSMLVALPDGDATYAWRVFATDRRVGHYAASGWMEFRVRQHQACQALAGGCGLIRHVDARPNAAEQP
jgi:hypothetical protein